MSPYTVYVFGGSNMSRIANIHHHDLQLENQMFRFRNLSRSSETVRIRPTRRPNVFEYIDQVLPSLTSNDILVLAIQPNDIPCTQMAFRHIFVANYTRLIQNIISFGINPQRIIMFSPFYRYNRRYSRHIRAASRELYANQFVHGYHYIDMFDTFPSFSPSFFIDDRQVHYTRPIREYIRFLLICKISEIINEDLSLDINLQLENVHI